MNTKSNFIFWWRWLVGVNIGVMLFGLALVFLPGFTRQAFSLMVFADPALIDAFPPEAVRYITLSHGVMGSVMFGWGVAMMLTLLSQFRDGVRMGWLNLALSVGLWYLPDTYLSLQTGFWQNAILNTVFAILFVIPLAATYRMFQTK